MLKNLPVTILFSCLIGLISTHIVAAPLHIETYSGKMMPQSNSAILMTDSKALVIDAQFLRPDAQALVAQIEKSGRTLSAILITHEHPDHVWGAVELLKKYPHAKVYARSAIIDEITLYFRARLLRWTEDVAEHVPTSLFDMQALVGDSFDFEGHEIKIIDLKPAETIHATAYYIPELKTYIAGDQIFYKTHAYIAGGLNYPELWIDSIQSVRKQYDIDVVVPGHGPVGNVEVFDSAVEYLQAYADIYQPLLKQSVIVKQMLSRFPDYALKEVLFMTTGPAVTAPDLIEMMQGELGFSKKH